MTKQAKSTALRALDTKEMVYTVGEEEVRLTGETVKKYLVRGNDDITDQDLVLFMNLCKYQKLNPFIGEAYLIKYGKEAQIITSKEAFMKRAESHPEYQGLQAGIVIQRDKEIIEVEGAFHLPTDKIIGGWAKVYRKDKVNPFYQSVSFAEYDKKQALWKDKPSTMIRKVAIVQALREAFPTNLGAMYTEAEMSEIKPIEVQVEEELEERANTETLDFDKAEAVDIEPQEARAEVIVEINSEEAEETEAVEQMNMEEMPY